MLLLIICGGWRVICRWKNLCLYSFQNFYDLFSLWFQKFNDIFSLFVMSVHSEQECDKGNDNGNNRNTHCKTYSYACTVTGTAINLLT